MPLQALLTSVLPPIHLLAYSTLLGTELYQSFIIVKIAHQALPRSAFTQLQARVFPIYFATQSLLLLIVSATVPPHGFLSMIRKKNVWIPLVVAGITAGLNLVLFGPRTKDLMVARVHQGMLTIMLLGASAEWMEATRDAEVQAGAGMVSEAMGKLNRSFSRAHAMSIHLNLVSIGAMVWYGWHLASLMKFG